MVVGGTTETTDQRGEGHDLAMAALRVEAYDRAAQFLSSQKAFTTETLMQFTDALFRYFATGEYEIGEH